jgi:hypothetical protein
MKVGDYMIIRCGEHAGRVEAIKKVCLDSYGEEVCWITATLMTKKEI